MRGIQMALHVGRKLHFVECDLAARIGPQWLSSSVLRRSIRDVSKTRSSLPSKNFVETWLTELDCLILPPYLDSDQKITVKTISAFEDFQKSKLWKDCNWDDVMSGDGCLHLSVQQSNHEKTSNYFKANQNLILNLSASHCIQYIAPPSFLLPHLGETGGKTCCASCVSSHSLCKRKGHREGIQMVDSTSLCVKKKLSKSSETLWKLWNYSSRSLRLLSNRLWTCPRAHAAPWTVTIDNTDTFCQRCVQYVEEMSALKDRQLPCLTTSKAALAIRLLFRIYFLMFSSSVHSWVASHHHANHLAACQMSSAGIEMFLSDKMYYVIL